MQGFVGRSSALELGSVTLENLVTHFQVSADSSLRDSIAFRNGIIGNQLLSRFNVDLDYPNRILYLTPRRRFARTSAYDRSGLKVITDASNVNSARVQFVSPNTPAADAGLRAGDRIRKINGLPIRLITLETLQRKLVGRAGKKIRLQIERASASFDVELVLRDLI